jgi:DNA modification methylase
MQTSEKLSDFFKNAKNDPDWAFEGERSHNLLTHGYHRYPAKFVPQLVGKILDEYHVDDGGTICDPFAGCGTTLVESKVRGLTSVGVDVNPVAQLITRAKTNALNPDKLEITVQRVSKKIQRYIDGKDIPKGLKFPKHERIDYWFSEDAKREIALILKIIEQEENKNHKLFLHCALSNILKDSSRWLQSSTKPQIDPIKTPKSAMERFLKHLNLMVKKNAEFFKLLKLNNGLRTKSEIVLADARDTKIKSGSISMVITSPPYVTSYEYADIHQLSGYWFEYISDLPTFRKKFIGSAYISKTSDKDFIFPITATKTLEKLEKADKRVARDVSMYFRDMQLVAKEISRILKKGGKACVVIGNTTMKNVHIPNAEVLAEMFENVDIYMERTIKRSIPHKLIPTIRDKESGRFAKKDAKNSKTVYPEEYILIMRKK